MAKKTTSVQNTPPDENPSRAEYSPDELARINAESIHPALICRNPNALRDAIAKGREDYLKAQETFKIGDAVICKKFNFSGKIVRFCTGGILVVDTGEAYSTPKETPKTGYPMTAHFEDVEFQF